MGIVSPLDLLRGFVRAVYCCSWGWTYYKYLPLPPPKPRPDRCLVPPDIGWSCHCGPGSRDQGADAMFCIREDWRVRVMLFVTDIPGGSDGGGEMFNVVQHLLFTQAWHGQTY